jgi:hypothetical protein
VDAPPRCKIGVAAKIMRKKKQMLIKHSKKDSPPLSDHAYYGEDSIIEP